MSALLVNLAGLALMGAVIWWFWLAPGQKVSAPAAPEPAHNARPKIKKQRKSR